MILYTCQCEWQFWVGRKIVIGPFIGKNSALAKAMSRRDWSEQYADCAGGFHIKTIKNRLRNKK